jgi:hypothetical protein
MYAGFPKVFRPWMEVEVTGLFLAGLVRTPALPDLFVGSSQFPLIFMKLIATIICFIILKPIKDYKRQLGVIPS